MIVLTLVAGGLLAVLLVGLIGAVWRAWRPLRDPQAGRSPYGEFNPDEMRDLLSRYH